MKRPRSVVLSMFVLATAILLPLILFSSFLRATPISAETREWPQVALASVTSGLDDPVHITHAGDGSGRLFVVEQRGRIRVVQNGALLPAPFLDITGRVLCCGERGLLSVAFPPGYAAKGYFYVNYTNAANNTIISRFRLTSDPNRAEAGSEEVVLTVEQPPFPNHKGGQIAFGPSDGYLYIGTGDGGSGGDPGNRAQNPAELLGKLLRIDVESGTAPYAVPPSNPFVQTPGYRGEIWALGLRNPWRFSFDRLTGDLYTGDVGQGGQEEIDAQLASSAGGENYGWRIMEGTSCYGASSCNTSGLTMPVLTYPTRDGCAVTGGFAYRGPTFPRMQGMYFFADYCNGRLSGLYYDGAGWQNTVLQDASFTISSFGEGESGELYLADYSNGVVYQVTDPSGASVAPALHEPADGAQLSGLGATLSWTNPSGTTQYQVQVAPFGGDGPGINLIRNTETSFTIEPPVMGQGNYVVLPGMSYTWRVRVTTKATFAPEDDPEWGAWSPSRSFRTPAPTSDGLEPVSPAPGATVGGAGPQSLRWQHPSASLFYWEVQVSGDTRFDADPGTATSFVWWNLVHGGATDPLNSWQTPGLAARTTYFWRVRPRVQGEGAPVAWSPAWSFSTP